jgi:hypothetical protein
VDGAAGEELPNDEAAWREATLIASGLIKDSSGFKPAQEWTLEVTDEDRNPIYRIRVNGEKMPARWRRFLARPPSGISGDS